MSIPVQGVDPAVQKLLAGELAKSLWATAKPIAGGEEEGGSMQSSGAETYASMFTDVLANAIAGQDASGAKAKARRA
ncbi:MAG: hypothetical protein JWM31_585 [Solirubrobacterales bacterium]|nr:hypothetical protein [Solirubrobacterales bacterium]